MYIFNNYDNKFNELKGKLNCIAKIKSPDEYKNEDYVFAYQDTNKENYIDRTIYIEYDDDNNFDISKDFFILEHEAGDKEITKSESLVDEFEEFEIAGSVHYCFTRHVYIVNEENLIDFLAEFIS